MACPPFSPPLHRPRDIRQMLRQRVPLHKLSIWSLQSFQLHLTPQFSPSKRAVCGCPCPREPSVVAPVSVPTFDLVTSFSLSTPSSCQQPQSQLSLPLMHRHLHRSPSSPQRNQQHRSQVFRELCQHGTQRQTWFSHLNSCKLDLWEFQFSSLRVIKNLTTFNLIVYVIASGCLTASTIIVNIYVQYGLWISRNSWPDGFVSPLD